MNKQFVTYEIALKLKELGFDEKCIASYYTNGTRMGYMDNERKKLFYSAYWDENGQCYSMSEEQPTHWRPIELK